MLTKAKVMFGCLKTVVLMVALASVGLSSLLAADTSADMVLRAKLEGFRRYLTLALKESVLAEMTAKDSKSRIIELNNWPHAPLEVESSINKGNIRVRFEKDFIVIWCCRPISLVDGKSTPLDIVRQVTKDVLGNAFVLGEIDTLRHLNSPPVPKHEKIMVIWPKEIPETKAIICTYRNLSELFLVHILARDKDTIVVVERLTARPFRTEKNKEIRNFVYAGLIAAKARLTKDQAKHVRNKPVLARNVIFDPETDTKHIPDILLNGCMWPIDNEVAVGAKDVGPTSYLRPKPKKPTGTTKPEGT